jgi:RNA polymerase sigma factor (sigma-70 family)
MPSPILELIHRVVEDERTRRLSDQEMLSQFASLHDEAAFHTLLRRHGPMVLDVCRSLLRNEADIEDAFQATFLVLARKVSSIRKAASLPCWLHGVAYRTALKAQAAFAKRRKHEEQVGKREATTAAEDLSWGDVQRIVHEELERLAEDYRAPLVLCYLQGKTQDEAAALLGLPKGTLKGRLERARALLRRQLERRGLGPAAVVLASAWPAATSACLPPELLAVTIKSACVMAIGPAAPGQISPDVAALAEGVMRAMLLTKRNTVAVVAFMLAVGTIGSGMLFWQGPAEDLGLSAQNDQQTELPVSKQVQIARVVDRFVEQLKTRPVPPRGGADNLGLYLMDLQKTDVTLLAMEVDQKGAYCGSPCWSNDGERVLFDVSPGQQWAKTRLQMLDGSNRSVQLTSLGQGNCPTFSPDGKQIAYLLNPGSPPLFWPLVKAGIYVMNTDGSDRRWLAEFGGILKWSPDGQHLLTVSFTSPCQLTLLNVATGANHPIQFADLKVYSVPSWTDDDTIVAVVRSAEGVAIALVDVANPQEATLKETLWTKGHGLDGDPAYPVYDPRTRQGVFVSREQKGQALYRFGPGMAPQQLEPKRYDPKIASLALSPDGRYLLFCSERSAQSGRPTE